MAPIALSLAVVGPAAAQTQTNPRTDSPAATSPSHRYDSPSSAGTPASGKATGMLEGSVKKLDPGAGTVQVSSGPLGLFGKTLEINNDTQIQLDGRPGSIADIREGTKVKASYEARDGRNVATRIELLPRGESKARSADRTDRNDMQGPSSRKSQ
jgi:Cu/Ag efflux protein CusF